MAQFYPYKIIDGSETSICLRCFLTVGLRSNNLYRSEQDHVCDPLGRPASEPMRTSDSGKIVCFQFEYPPYRWPS